MKKKTDYIQRQTYIMSSLGLFYLMIIGLFAIPLLGTFVALFIKGILDLKYAILIGGIGLLSFAVYFLVKLVLNLFRRLKKDGISAGQELREMAGKGEPVELSLLNGMMTLTYQGGGQPTAPAIPYQPQDSIKTALLPMETEGKKQQEASDVITKLKELSELKNQGIITEDEFLRVKGKLLEAF